MALPAIAVQESVADELVKLLVEVRQGTDDRAGLREDIRAGADGFGGPAEVGDRLDRERLGGGGEAGP